MKLAAYLTMNEIKQRMMAEALSLHILTVNRWCTGRSMPTRSDMLRIYRWTNGEVQPNDFYDLPDLAVASPVTLHSNAAAGKTAAEPGPSAEPGPTPLLKAMEVAA